MGCRKASGEGVVGCDSLANIRLERETMWILFDRDAVSKTANYGQGACRAIVDFVSERAMSHCMYSIDGNFDATLDSEHHSCLGLVPPGN